MKYGQFPVGQPELVVCNELPRGILEPFPWTTPEQNPFRGILLCQVLPPRAMLPAELPPLLPYFSKCRGKLFFPLCAKCADLQSLDQCAHTDGERCWMAGFTHLELAKALELGYKILNVYEVIVKFIQYFFYIRIQVENYPEPQWASRTRQNGLFDGQIDALLKLKVLT